jgi:hypothetical protein
MHTERIRTFLALVLLLAVGAASAQMGSTYAVTITNHTPQPISPPVVVSHALDFQPVVPGQAADPAIWRLAEDGDAGELATIARVDNGVYEVVTAAGPLLPGESVTLDIGVTDDFHYLTVLGMLVATNDAFVFWGSEVGAATAMGGMGEAMGGDMMGMAPAIYDGVARVFDAGSEADTESCADIPGPPCGNAGVRVTNGAEGTIHLDGGILGVGDLDPASFDWLNPAISVTVESTSGM